jgi:hypothetical protein
MLESPKEWDQGRNEVNCFLTNLLGAEIVQWRDKNCECSIDANDPGKSKQVVDSRYEHGRFQNDIDRSHHRLEERIVLVT